MLPVKHYGEHPELKDGALLQVIVFDHQGKTIPEHLQRCHLLPGGPVSYNHLALPTAPSAEAPVVAARR
ncbi:hypothetical protein ACEE78_12080, partial [Staphylococcus hyicus]